MSLPPINRRRIRDGDCYYVVNQLPTDGYVTVEVGARRRRQVRVCAQDDDEDIDTYYVERTRANNPYKSTKCMDHRVLERMQDDVLRQQKRKKNPVSAIPYRGIVNQTEIACTLEGFHRGCERGVLRHHVTLPAVPTYHLQQRRSSSRYSGNSRRSSRSHYEDDGYGHEVPHTRCNRGELQRLCIKRRGSNYYAKLQASTARPQSRRPSTSWRGSSASSQRRSISSSQRNDDYSSNEYYYYESSRR